MTTDKNPNDKEAGPPGSDQTGGSRHRATIFNPDGSVQHKTQAGEPQQRAETPPPPAIRANMGTSTPTPPDMNAALLKRLADAASQSAGEQADELAEAIYTKFMHLLTDRITEKGGSLTMEDVVEMGEEFRAQIGDIKETFLRAVESYTQAREKNRVNSERGNIFQRIMAYQFERRFANERTLKEKPDLLSRRMLPGFYNVLSMMFGPPKLARYEQQSKTLVDRIRKESNGQIEWADVYKSPEARRLALRAEIDIARHFKDTEKRLDWMIAMINSNMIPLEDGKIHSGWSFTREAAEGMLTNLFHDLGSVLKNEPTRQKLVDELGDEAVTTLETVTRRFS